MQVPTNKPMVRKDLADVIYKTEEAKLRGIVTELLQLYCREQPVLVGTCSIEMSERVSRLEFQALEVLGATICCAPRWKSRPSRSARKIRRVPAAC